jgi:hypothetical protein
MLHFFDQPHDHAAASTESVELYGRVFHVRRHAGTGSAELGIIEDDEPHRHRLPAGNPEDGVNAGLGPHQAGCPHNGDRVPGSIDSARRPFDAPRKAGSPSAAAYGKNARAINNVNSPRRLTTRMDRLVERVFMVQSSISLAYQFVSQRYVCGTSGVAGARI